MIQEIWKYPLVFTGEQVVAAPAGAKVLCAQMQAGKVTLWALVDPTAEKRSLLVRIAGTGHQQRGELGEYAGTVQDGGYVWHVFAREAQ